MATANQVLSWVNVAVFVLLAVVAVVEWRRRGGLAALWAGLAFLALGIVELVGIALPDHTTTLAQDVALRILVLLLVLFPYLLYRFTTAFNPPTRALERRLGGMTIVLFLWTCALPSFPESGQPRPAWFIAYLIAFVFHWTVLSVVVAIRLWRGGLGQPNVARRRMHLLSFGAAMITVALLISAAGPRSHSPLALATALIALVSAVGFLLGVAPPSLLRLVWRRPETERVQAAIASLMRLATREEEVVDRVLEPMAAIVGARAVALIDHDGRILGTHGTSVEVVAETAQAGGELPTWILRVEISPGTLLVWTSPYAPFFGQEEFALLETLGVMTGLALDRSRLFAREREALVALQRADELKSNFIALAAHELRTPVTVVHGIVETLGRAGSALSTDQRAELEDALMLQADRMRRLVEQLLDLSRLEAEAVPIQPERFRVRDRLEEVVAGAAGDRGTDVVVDVSPGLEAYADPQAFDRILTNLVVNALRYGSRPVRITADRRDRHFRIAVEDRGRGVPVEFVPELFERFTRSEHSRAGAGGTGLGLAIARSYARAQRGDLLYRPAEPHGARFELVLPAEPDST